VQAESDFGFCDDSQEEEEDIPQEQPQRDPEEYGDEEDQFGDNQNLS